MVTSSRIHLNQVGGRAFGGRRQGQQQVRKRIGIEKQSCSVYRQQSGNSHNLSCVIQSRRIAPVVNRHLCNLRENLAVDGSPRVGALIIPFPLTCRNIRIGLHASVNGHVRAEFLLPFR